MENFMKLSTNETISPTNFSAFPQSLCLGIFGHFLGLLRRKLKLKQFHIAFFSALDTCFKNVYFT